MKKKYTHCKLTGRRLTYIKSAYTEKQRKEMYDLHLEEAKKWVPPLEYDKAVYLNQGDPGYEDACFFEEVTFAWKFPKVKIKKNNEK